MTLNRLQRAALIAGLVAIGIETTIWLLSPSSHHAAFNGLGARFLSWGLVYKWVATAAFTIAAMVLVGTRWYKRKKSS